jgi:hypothetical protein
MLPLKQLGDGGARHSALFLRQEQFLKLITLVTMLLRIPSAIDSVCAFHFISRVLNI